MGRAGSWEKRWIQYPYSLSLHASPLPTLHLSLHVFPQWRARRFSALEHGIHPPQAQSKIEELEPEAQPETELELEPDPELELEQP